MATASTTARTTVSLSSDRSGHLKLLLPYGLAILAQLPMLFLYFRGIWGRPHYQFFPFALLVVAALAWVRWPRKSEMPYRSSRISDVLFILGFVFALAGQLFVEPRFTAVSATLIVTSLFARTRDPENHRTLWACALPLFVCLLLPGNLDNTIITRLQSYSAQFTSMILDLIRVGHNLDGIHITLASGKGYNIEQGCSGVVSFFTLVAITTAYVVWVRRVQTPSPGTAIALAGLGLSLIPLDRLITSDFGYLSLIGVALVLIGVLGFRAGLLLMSTVFWALFMNTIRILLIPLADLRLNGLDLSTGIAHDLLGYFALIVGVLLVLSTDQFLTFLFGPVEDAGEETTGLQRPVTRFWNSFLAGKSTTEGAASRRKGIAEAAAEKPISETQRKFIWALAGVIAVIGVLQLWDVRNSYAKSGFAPRFFNRDVTIDYQKDDLPERLGNWEQLKYDSVDRTRGSDLGQRSDNWIFQGPRSLAITSIDQTFPGWHELTTCYKNQGWQVRSRQVASHDKGEEASNWPFVVVHLTKNTGERGYLLFSLFDSQGQPVDPPMDSFNAFIVRVQNRLSNRIRATLFDGEAYQTQLFMQSFNEFDEDIQEEAKERYLQAREIFRDKFVERRAKKSE